MFRILELYRIIKRQGQGIMSLNNKIVKLNIENAYYKKLLIAKNNKIDKLIEKCTKLEKGENNYEEK